MAVRSSISRIVELTGREHMTFWIMNPDSSEGLKETVHAWCRERYGPPGEVWTAVNADIRFHDARAAVEFKLRWV
jgi:hypothetical protein